MKFEDNSLYISHKTWEDVKHRKFGCITICNTFRDVLTRGGTVYLLLPDGQGIKRCISRPNEIDELFAEINAKDT